MLVREFLSANPDTVTFLTTGVHPSSCRVIDGSVCDERTAGTQQASKPTRVSTAGTRVKVNMSRELLRKSMDSTVPAAARERMHPATTPMAIGRMPRRAARPRSRAERHTDAHLATSLMEGIGDHAVDADHRKQQRQCAENG
jgi:hypothetical protein